MADTRARVGVKIVDPTTNANEAAVSAAGHLLVDVANVSDTTITVDTELPAAAALTDNFANPTAPGVGAFGMLWDGSTWDRAPGSSTGGQFVQGDIAHDGVADAFPLLSGGYASAAAPTSVSADGDAVRAWYLRNGAAAAVLTAAGALIGGDAANGLDVDVTRVTGTVTVDSELPAAAALTDNFANPTAPGVGAFNMVWDGATWDRAPGSSAGGAFVQGDIAHDGVADAFPLMEGGIASAAAPTSVSADGDAVRAWYIRNGAAATVITAAGALVGGDAANGLDVDVTRVTGTVTVDSELPSAAALADATSNPTVPGVGGFLMGYNGTTWDRVRTANTGRLQVDVITGGGVDTPVNPVLSYQTSSALAAGSAVALTTAEAASKKLSGVDVWASVAFKATITTVDNAVESGVKGIGGGAAYKSWQFTAPHRNYITLGATAGLDAFRVNVTNLDNSQAADVYAVFYYED